MAPSHIYHKMYLRASLQRKNESESSFRSSCMNHGVADDESKAARNSGIFNFLLFFLEWRLAGALHFRSEGEKFEVDSVKLPIRLFSMVCYEWLSINAQNVHPLLTECKRTHWCWIDAIVQLTASTMRDVLIRTAAPLHSNAQMHWSFKSLVGVGELYGWVGMSH